MISHFALFVPSNWPWGHFGKSKQLYSFSWEDLDECTVGWLHRSWVTLALCSSVMESAWWGSDWRSWVLRNLWRRNFGLEVTCEVPKSWLSVPLSSADKVYLFCRVVYRPEEGGVQCFGFQAVLHLQPTWDAAEQDCSNQHSQGTAPCFQYYL